MKILCTVLRQNGTYKTKRVNPSRKEFELDKNTYQVGKYHTGKVLGLIYVLRSFYIEGYPLPIDIYNFEKKLNNLKMDSRAITNLGRKKILNVLSDVEFTKLEKLVILVMLCVGAVSGACLVIMLVIAENIGAFA